MFIVIIICHQLNIGQVNQPVELLLANTAILITIYIIENNYLSEREFVKVIRYEKIDLIKPENYKLLIADLKERTGFDIKRAAIESIDFLNDTASLRIVYRFPVNINYKKSDNNE